MMICKGRMKEEDKKGKRAISYYGSRRGERGKRGVRQLTQRSDH